MQAALFWSMMIGVAGLFWYLKRPTVTSADAKRMVSEGALLVDVRSPAEFNEGHLPNARNIPVGEVASRTAELGDKSKPVIVYCRSGVRSAKAAQSLKSAGFSNVYNLGGMGNW